VRLLNFARGGLVNDADLHEAITQGIVGCYVTDFPDEKLIAMARVLAIPHLGASTPESEENCAVMAVEQLKDFLEHGNVKNSVNFPECILPQSTPHRLIIANRNVPNMIGQITPVLAEKKINIADMLNKSRGDYAYNIIDIESQITPELIDKLRQIEGVLMVRGL
jgi:D-3-phosphoglycerate dehydrogenase